MRTVVSCVRGRDDGGENKKDESSERREKVFKVIIYLEELENNENASR